ncbi:hypothetical protein MIND_00627700 [Mycena indigotica]|uniref:Uncharacterized protein n=1 Tax=Mycena indigotica TaxID=2126181 RepID=A0A8H6SRN9_9AGAR|nr:uncharacterized protein MIND_00627700 [Mycena indigotica]KAF7303968.1 hypothetical protein MIND_00627700 [Mycena indigotica]
MQSQQHYHSLPIQAGLGPIVNVRANATAPRAGLGRDTTTDRVKPLDASGRFATPSNSHPNCPSDEEDDVDDTRGLFSDAFDMNELEEADNEEGTSGKSTSVEPGKLQPEDFDFEELERQLNEELGGEGETRELSGDDSEWGDLEDAEGEDDDDMSPDGAGAATAQPQADVVPISGGTFPSPATITSLAVHTPPTTRTDDSAQLLVEPLQLAATQNGLGPQEDEEVHNFDRHSEPNYEYVPIPQQTGYGDLETGSSQPQQHNQYAHWPQPGPVPWAAPSQHAPLPTYGCYASSQPNYYAMPTSYDAYYGQPPLPAAHGAVNPHQQQYPYPAYYQHQQPLPVAAGPQYAHAASNYPPPPPQRYGYSHNNAVVPNAGPQNIYPMPPPSHAYAHDAYPPNQRLYPHQQQAAWAATPRAALHVPSRNANTNTVFKHYQPKHAGNVRFAPYPAQAETAKKSGHRSPVKSNQGQGSTMPQENNAPDLLWVNTVAMNAEAGPSSRPAVTREHRGHVTPVPVSVPRLNTITTQHPPAAVPRRRQQRRRADPADSVVEAARAQLSREILLAVERTETLDMRGDAAECRMPAGAGAGGVTCDAAFRVGKMKEKVTPESIRDHLVQFHGYPKTRGRAGAGADLLCRWVMEDGSTCNGPFKNALALGTHVLKMHGKQDWVRCVGDPECGRLFHSKKALIVHLVECEEEFKRKAQACWGHVQPETQE